MTTSTGGGSVNLVVENGTEALAAARSKWRDLAARSGAGYFQSWEWVTAWHEVLEPRARIVLVEAPDAGGRWAGLLPVAFLSRRLHRRVPAKVRYLGLAGSGRGAGDHLGPLMTTADLTAPLVAEALRQAGSRPLYLESLDPTVEDNVNTVLRGRCAHRVACPRVEFNGVSRIEDIWSAKVRKNLRRRDRMLAEEGITGRWIEAGDDMVEQLRAFQEVHRARWREQGQAGMLDDHLLAFMRRLSELAAPPDGPSLYLLQQASTKVVGALLVFRHGRVLSTYKTGWDPTYASLGLGIAMHSAAMRRAHSDGFEIFDFLRGQGSHKYSLGAIDRHDVCLLRTRGVSGALLGLREAGAERALAAKRSAAGRPCTGPAGNEDG